MKKILSLIFISFVALSMDAQVCKTVSPTYLATILLDEPTAAKMESVCQYYKLTPISDESGYKTYEHSDGTVFKFKVDKDGDKSFPEVIVNSKNNPEKVEKVLKEAGYVKTNDGYVKGSRFEHRRSRCRITGNTNKIFTFTKEYKTAD